MKQSKIHKTLGYKPFTFSFFGGDTRTIVTKFTIEVFSLCKRSYRILDTWCHKLESQLTMTHRRHRGHTTTHTLHCTALMGGLFALVLQLFQLLRFAHRAELRPGCGAASGQDSAHCAVLRCDSPGIAGLRRHEARANVWPGDAVKLGNRHSSVE